MPRRNRTFTSSDVLRIIADNLSSLEQAEVVFELRFGPMRRLMKEGRGFDEEDFRMLNKFIQKLRQVRGGR